MGCLLLRRDLLRSRDAEDHPLPGANEAAREYQLGLTFEDDDLSILHCSTVPVRWVPEVSGA